MVEVIHTSWIDRIGIIKARDKITYEIRYYIGVGQGLSEEADIEYILAWGHKFTEEELLRGVLKIDTSD